MWKLNKTEERKRVYSIQLLDDEGKEHNIESIFTLGKNDEWLFVVETSTNFTNVELKELLRISNELNKIKTK